MKRTANRTESAWVATRPVLILGGLGWRQGLHQRIWSDSEQLQTRATVHKGWLTCARSCSWLWAELGDVCPAITQLYCSIPVQHCYYWLFLLLLSVFLIFYLFIWLCWSCMWHAGKPGPAALGVWSLSHWTPREVLCFFSFLLF